MRVNEAIRIKTIRLIDENNEQVGVIDTLDAKTRALEAGLDLVEVAPNADPPVCRIMDYGKWIYQQKRKERKAHKKSHTVQLKEVRLRPEIDPHDLNIKVDRARKFLEKGHRVQFTLMFRGRQMIHTEIGYEMLENLYESLSDIAKIDRKPTMSGRRMTMVVVPNKV